MADEEKDETPKDELPLLKELEKRARDAEKRAKELEATDKKRSADAAAAAESAKLRDLDEAKGQIEQMRKREADALALLSEFEGRERARVDTMLATLGDESRARLEKYAQKLSLADYAGLVAEEATRLGAAGAAGASEGDGYAPPPASPGGRRQTTAKALHPKTEEILDMLGVNPTVGRELVNCERDPGDKWRARFVYPAKALVAALKERVTHPVRMNAENLAAVVKAGKVTSR